MIKGAIFCTLLIVSGVFWIVCVFRTSQITINELFSVILATMFIFVAILGLGILSDIENAKNEKQSSEDASKS